MRSLRTIGMRGVTLGLALLSAAACGQILGLDEFQFQAPCATDADCDDGNDCTVDSCADDGHCHADPGPDGPAAVEVPGDCRTLSCAGGELVEQRVDTDYPDDQNDCTIDECINGDPSNSARPDGEGCFVGQAQGLCQGGACAVGCGTGLPPCDDSNPCTEDACDASVGQCLFTALSGVPPIGEVDSMPGDCQRLECDGYGGMGIVPYDLDVPVDDNQCTNDSCSGATPSNPAVSDGMPCDQNGGQICAAGECLKDLGQGCTVASECASGFCADGHCCTAACTGACVSCNNAQGQCTNVGSGVQDTCSAGSVCNGAGACRKINGQTCTVNSQCLSSKCVDGICCSSICDQPCRACNVPGNLGTCVVDPTTLNSQDSCGSYHYCDSDGTCYYDPP